MMNKRSRVSIILATAALLLTLGIGYLYLPSYLGDTFCTVPEEYAPTFRSAAEEVGYDVFKLVAVAKVESGFNPKAISPVGAKGIMQMMDGTIRSVAGTMGISNPNPYDVTTSIRAGAHLLEYYQDKFATLPAPYNDIAVYAAYNNGEGAITPLVVSGSYQLLPSNYARKVMATEACMRASKPNRELLGVKAEIRKPSVGEAKSLWKMLLEYSIKFNT